MTKSYVSIENFICPVCGKQHDDGADVCSSDCILKCGFALIDPDIYKYITE